MLLPPHAQSTHHGSLNFHQDPDASGFLEVWTDHRQIDPQPVTLLENPMISRLVLRENLENPRREAQSLADTDTDGQNQDGTQAKLMSRGDSRRQSPPRNRKRDVQEAGNTDNGTGGGGARRSKVAKRMLQDPSRLLACVYYKNDLETFRYWRLCSGPGWSDIRRLKEHLCRRHTAAAHRNEALLSSARQRCPPDGLTADQLQQLTSRKRSKNVVSVEDKWREIYKIVFPETLDEDIPSPYYDMPELQQPQGLTTPIAFMDRVSALNDTITSELPEVVGNIFGRDASAQQQERLANWILDTVNRTLVRNGEDDMLQEQRVPCANDDAGELVSSHASYEDTLSPVWSLEVGAFDDDGFPIFPPYNTVNVAESHQGPILDQANQ